MSAEHLNDNESLYSLYIDLIDLKISVKNNEPKDIILKQIEDIIDSLDD